MTRPQEWKRIDSENVADCRIFKVRRDLSKNVVTGQTAQFFVIENPDWINVIPVTPDREVVLIEQFRHGIQEFTLEIPGGMVDRGESPLIAASRELTEETGYVSSDLIQMGKSRPNPAIQDNWIYHFLAPDCRYTGQANFDEHESIVTKLVPLKEIPEMITNGEIGHSLVVAAFHYLGNLQIYEG